jgi:Autotransporter beta-domain
MHRINTGIVAKIMLSIAINVIIIKANAQDSSKLFFTTSVGLLSPLSKFSNAYKTSLALNSGIEYMISKNYFAQFVLDFNAVNYDQQVKDASSHYLFQNTSSSVFLVGLNIGRNIGINKSGSFFVSPYLGLGYSNIGEPRLTINNTTNIITQEVTRMNGLFTRGGLRLGYKTKSKVLQTIYVDASYWTANVTVQDSKPQALSILVGTRFGF